MFMQATEEKSLDLEELSVADFVCINLDLILYKDPSLLNKAFEMLIKFHSQYAILHNMLDQVQLIEEREVAAILHESEEKITILRKSAEKCEFWLGASDRNG